MSIRIRDGFSVESQSYNTLACLQSSSVGLVSLIDTSAELLSDEELFFRLLSSVPGNTLAKAIPCRFRRTAPCISSRSVYPRSVFYCVFFLILAVEHEGVQPTICRDTASLVFSRMVLGHIHCSASLRLPQLLPYLFLTHL